MLNYAEEKGGFLGVWKQQILFWTEKNSTIGATSVCL